MVGDILYSLAKARRGVSFLVKQQFSSDCTFTQSYYGHIDILGIDISKVIP